MPKDSLLSKSVTLHLVQLFQEMMLRAEKHADGCIQEVVAYNKARWDRTHKDHDIKVGDRFLISTLNFQNLGGSRKLKDQFVGPFFVKDFHGRNAMEVILTEGYDLEHPTFPISLVKKYVVLEDCKIVEPLVAQWDKEQVGVKKVPHKILNNKMIRVQGLN